jgi:hypothetical protein
MGQLQAGSELEMIQGTSRNSGASHPAHTRMGLHVRGMSPPAHADRHTGLGATQFVTGRKAGLNRRKTQEGIA